MKLIPNYFLTESVTFGGIELKSFVIINHVIFVIPDLNYW